MLGLTYFFFISFVGIYLHIHLPTHPLLIVIIIPVKTRISTRVLHVALSDVGLINMDMFGCGMDRERDGRTACTAVAETIN